MQTQRSSSRSKLSLDYLFHSDHAFRVASLNLEKDEDIWWSELIDEEWDRWNTDKLRERWAALRAKVGASATHRGEYITY